MQKAVKWNPDPHQVYCSKRGEAGSLALLLDPGLGKTSILLDIFCKLKKKNKTKGALVIAPLMPCTLTWPDEIKSWSNFKHLKYTILRGQKHLNKQRKVDLYLINPERLNWLFNEILPKIPKSKWPFDTLIVDESAKFKHTSSARTKLLLKQLDHFKYRYIANGTPTGNGFIQLYSQMYIVDKGKALGRTKQAFLNRFFVQVGNPQWRTYELASKKEEKKMLKAIQPSAVCLIAEEHVKMPKRLIRPRYITLPDKALKVYKEIEDEMFTQLECGDELVAESAASLATMLHQICSGAVYNMQDPLEEYQPPLKRGFTILHDEKIKALKDLIEELNGKQLLIGYKFQSDREILAKSFGKDITFFTGKDVEQIQTKWNDGKIKILAGQMQSIGFGLNLQKGGAQHIAVYSAMHDFEVFDQFTRRLYRRGNVAKQVYIHMFLAKGLYDDLVVYKALQNRGESHASVFAQLVAYQRKRDDFDI